MIIGQQDAKFSRVAKPEPEPNKKPTESSSPATRDPVEDDMKGFSTVLGLIAAGVVVGIIVVIACVMYVLKKIGCFRRS